jgi:hypothetical protein
MMQNWRTLLADRLTNGGERSAGLLIEVSMNMPRWIIDRSHVLPVTENEDGTFTIGETRISRVVADSLMCHGEAAGVAILLMDPERPESQLFRSYVPRIVLLVQAGDTVELAHAVVAMNTDLLPLLRVKTLPVEELSGMPMREGAGEAAEAAAATVAAFPAETANSGCDAEELRAAGTRAKTQFVVRNGFQLLERTVGANELQNLPYIRDQIGHLVLTLGNKAESHPKIAALFHEALQYNKEAAERGARSRVQNAAWRSETEAKIRGEVVAKAREEGRRDALNQISDRLSGIVETSKK